MKDIKKVSIKVYCKNCNYVMIEYNKANDKVIFCEYPKNIKMYKADCSYEETADIPIHKRNPYMINSNNSCKWYKKK